MGVDIFPLKDADKLTPVPGHLYRQIRGHMNHRERERRSHWGWKPKKRKPAKGRMRRLRERKEVVAWEYAKTVFPEIFDQKFPDVPKVPPRFIPVVPRGASSREFALIMLKHLQWEKFVSTGRYERVREYIISQNAKKKAKAPSGQPSKFNNVRCVYDGHSFDSILEKNRYIFLKLQEKYGVIKDLEVHPSYPLGDDLHGFLVIKSKTRKAKCTYKPDFRYKIVATDEEIVEDVKSVATLEEYSFKIKRGVWEWFYDAELRVVTSVAAPPGSTKY